MVRFKWWALSLAVSGCSVFIHVDENDYKIPANPSGGTGGVVDDDGPNGGLGGGPNTDTGGTSSDSGGMGGAPDAGGTGASDAGGSTSGGTGGEPSTGGSSGGNGAGGGSGGTDPSGGSSNVLEYYYPLDATMGTQVLEAGSGMLHGTASTADGWASQGGIAEGGYELLPGRSIQLNSSLASKAPFSVSFWMNPTQGSYRVVASKRASPVDGDGTGGASTGGFLVLQNNNYMQLRTGAMGMDLSHDYLSDGKPVIVLGDPQNAAWYHVVLTYQENLGGPQDRLRLYVNSQLVIETIDELSDKTPENDSAPLRFGDNSANEADFQGMLDEIRVFRWELNSDEIQALYTAVAPR